MEQAAVRLIGPKLLTVGMESLLSGQYRLVPSQAKAGAGQVVVLLGLNSDMVQTHLRRYGAQNCVLVTSTAELERGDFRKFGITAFGDENESSHELAAAIQRAAKGQGYCPLSLMDALVKSTCQRASVEMSSQVDTASSLSDREREVVSLVLKGWSNEEVAEHLFVTVSTVKYHLFNVYRKLKIKRRTELITALTPHLKIS